jgi:hypothetical protein
MNSFPIRHASPAERFPRVLAIVFLMLVIGIVFACSVILWGCTAEPASTPTTAAQPATQPATQPAVAPPTVQPPAPAGFSLTTLLASIGGALVAGAGILAAVQKTTGLAVPASIAKDAAEVGVIAADVAPILPGPAGAVATGVAAVAGVVK